MTHPPDREHFGYQNQPIKKYYQSQNPTVKEHFLRSELIFPAIMELNSHVLDTQIIIDFKTRIRCKFHARFLVQ